MVTDRRGASAAQKADLDAAAAQRLSGWLRDYRPLPGIPDELLDATGRPRDHWLNFLGHFAEYPDQEFRSRFSLATRHIRDTGVSYRIYGEETERTWPAISASCWWRGRTWWSARARSMSAPSRG